MRKIVTDNELDTLLFHQITDKLARVFRVDTTKQRIDSVHIKSNMRRLGRISNLFKEHPQILGQLKKHTHKEIFETLPKDLLDKYLPKKALSCFFMVKTSDSERTLASVSGDLFELVQRFSGQQLPVVCSGFERAMQRRREFGWQTGRGFGKIP